MDIHAIHTILIILHSVSATISFFAGSLLMVSHNYTSTQRMFSLYWWTLVGMVVLLAGAILVYWTEYADTQRIIFPGLLILGMYMLYRARSANSMLASQEANWKRPYIEHIGFTLISLFEGFIIVSGLNSGLPGWLVALIAIIGVLLGRWLIGVTQRRTV